MSTRYAGRRAYARLCRGLTYQHVAVVAELCKLSAQTQGSWSRVRQMQDPNGSGMPVVTIRHEGLKQAVQEHVAVAQALGKSLRAHLEDLAGYRDCDR